MRCYTSWFQTFAKWCEKRGTPSLPTNVEVVAIYIADQTKALTKPASIVSYMVAIAWAHERAGYVSPTNHQTLSQLLKGAGRAHAKSPNAAPMMRAHPLSADELLVMIEALPTANLTASRVRGEAAQNLLRAEMKSVLLTAWHLGRRLDELTRADLSWVTAAKDRVAFTASSQKRKPGGFSNTMYKTDAAELCPVRALDEWIELSAPYRNGLERLYPEIITDHNGNVTLVDRITVMEGRMRARRPHIALLAPNDRAVAEAALRADALHSSVAQLRRRLVSWMKDAGIEPVRADRRLSGHSSRRGLATELHRVGVGFENVSQHIGWDSLDMARRYSDHHEPNHPLKMLDI